MLAGKYEPGRDRGRMRERVQGVSLLIPDERLRRVRGVSEVIDGFRVRRRLTGARSVVLSPH